MPTLILSNLDDNLDGSVKAKTFSFLQKLSVDDTTPGLHIEPIRGSVDPRVRTGRVDRFWRAVLFRLDKDGEIHYLFHGVWPHDKANRIAETVRLTLNPVNGLAQFEETAPALRAAEKHRPAAPADSEPVPLLSSFGLVVEDLTDRLGIPQEVAVAALVAQDDDALLALAGEHEGWLGMVLVDLAAGESLESIIGSLQLDAGTASTVDDDGALLDALQRPASRAQYTFVDGQEELRRVIDTGDFAAWRTFLHPEQRRYVEATYGGAFRLSGGAGTGKTVVLIHRARRLARKQPLSRTILTTYTTNLAESLRKGFLELDSSLSLATAPGDPGVLVSGVDALVSAMVRAAGNEIAAATEVVLGERRSRFRLQPRGDRWRGVISSFGSELAPEVSNESFLSAEYALVVLPNRVTTESEYLRSRRQGRGAALDRATRAQVWNLIARYRSAGTEQGVIDFDEAAEIAAAHLDLNPADRPADHVLVDEAQDLSPSHVRFVRALTARGVDDLFLAEDSHQRIYGPRVVLGRYGIRIVGRSRRLSLNYRTTAQNLRYAMTVLDGGDYVDMENSAESATARSARSGPEPRVATASTPEDELRLIADETRRWLADGESAGTVAVLVRDRNSRERIAEHLNRAGVRARAIDRGTIDVDRVSVMTMHRAKGMEFTKVVLVSRGFVSSGARRGSVGLDQRDADLRARSLEYVAATRARDELVVVRSA